MKVTSAAVAGITLAALLVGTGAVVLLGRAGDDTCAGSAVAGGAIGGPFTLVDETGATVTDADVIDRPALVYFGYTFCPDVCPIDAARNAAAVDILAERGIDMRPLFITIDPARDTAPVLAAYTENFHPQMIGLTGSDDQIAQAAGAYRVVYRRADDDPAYYLMDHSVFTYLVTPQDGFVTFFRREDGPQAMADQIACYLG